jgi:hypothetical protein
MAMPTTKGRELGAKDQCSSHPKAIWRCTCDQEFEDQGMSPIIFQILILNYILKILLIFHLFLVDFVPYWGIWSPF